jgi:hypothetical protein
MITWQAFYEKHKSNTNENIQSLWMKYNRMIYENSIYSSSAAAAGAGAGGGSGNRRDPSENLYVENDYIDDYFE